MNRIVLKSNKILNHNKGTNNGIYLLKASYRLLLFFFYSYKTRSNYDEYDFNVPFDENPSHDCISGT